MQGARDQTTDQPPSLGSTAPFTFAESSLSSQVIAAASCSGCATGGMATCMIGPTRPAAYSLRIGASMFVATAPGATALARMPCGPWKNATLFVNPAIACFDAVYAAPPRESRRAAIVHRRGDGAPPVGGRGRASAPLDSTSQP